MLLAPCSFPHANWAARSYCPVRHFVVTERFSKRMSERSSKKMRTSQLPAANGVTTATTGHSTYSFEHTVGSSFIVPGLVATDHFFRVPMDYSNATKSTITVFVREVVAPCKAKDNLPFLLYLQGGPGFEGPRPVEASTWIKSAASMFRVLLMDQRGTGLSTPITTASLLKLSTPEEQAEYLAHFRADSIVHDAEAIRSVFVPIDTAYGGKWSILGQSFGGFCSLTYLSFAPQGLYEALLTGGIAPLITEACGARQVYRSLYRRVIKQNQKYYQRFPLDVTAVHKIVTFLDSQPDKGVETPCGNKLTARSFQLLGLSGLGSGGGFERLHYLIERAFDGQPDATELSIVFLKGFDSAMSWDTNPLYGVLHESIYCQGAASQWAAEHVRNTEFSNEFDAIKAVNESKPVYFTGEMVFPFMFDDIKALRPLKAVAELLAQKSDWGPLYDIAALESNKVPVAAATYVEDMYVDYDLAQGTASHVKGIRQWVTNEYMHSGIRDDGARIFEQLLGMTRGNVVLY